ncbi:hypothetical protein C8R47DRAFT_1216452 [Mycena vitilis]|nr:hypothetical protein C8R47DRAFT_1216452 [Mycena vitilis]
MVEWMGSDRRNRLGSTIRGAYRLASQTQLFPTVPPGFHTSRMWEAFELLALADRYEGIIAVEPCLDALSAWISVQIVPGMNVGRGFDFHMDKT